VAKHHQERAVPLLVVLTKEVKMNEILIQGQENQSPVQMSLLFGQVVNSLDTMSDTVIPMPEGAEPSDMVVVIYHRLTSRVVWPQQPGWNKAFQTAPDYNSCVKEVYWCFKEDQTYIRAWNNSVGAGFDYTALLVRGATSIKSEHQFQYSNYSAPISFTVPYLNSFFIASGRSQPPVITGPSPDSSFTGNSYYFFTEVRGAVYHPDRE